MFLMGVQAPWAVLAAATLIPGTGRGPTGSRAGPQVTVFGAGGPHCSRRGSALFSSCGLFRTFRRPRPRRLRTYPFRHDGCSQARSSRCGRSGMQQSRQLAVGAHVPCIERAARRGRQTTLRLAAVLARRYSAICSSSRLTTSSAAPCAASTTGSWRGKRSNTEAAGACGVSKSSNVGSLTNRATCGFQNSAVAYHGPSKLVDQSAGPSGPTRSSSFPVAWTVYICQARPSAPGRPSTPAVEERRLQRAHVHAPPSPGTQASPDDRPRGHRPNRTGAEPPTGWRLIPPAVARTVGAFSHGGSGAVKASRGMVRWVW